MVIMKSSTMNTVNSESSGVVESGRVTKIRHNNNNNNNTHHRSLENEEIQMYLSKLKELVPFMPKNRKLSKLEVIQYVIDYICDLQSALDTNPTLSAVAVAAAAVNSQTQSPSNRQPLGVIPPNTITNTCASLEQNSVAPLSHLAEKVVTPADSRPVSC